MKFKLICFLLLMLVSCKKNELPAPIINGSIDIIPEKIGVPLFMTLSPKMSDMQFNKEIINLNNKGELEDYKLPLILNGLKCNFKITKEHKCISLFYLSDNSVRVFNGDPFPIIPNNGNSKIKALTNFLTKKYKLNETQIPNDINYSKFGLDNKNNGYNGYQVFTLFKGEGKYVLFTYYYDNNIIASDSTNELTDIVELHIQYYFTEDFDTILKNMNLEKSKKLKKEQDEEIKRVEQKNKLINNSNKL